MDPVTHQPVFPPKPGAKTADLQKLATEFEAVFLAEMLKSAGLGKPPTGFGGGTGEDQFTSFLLAEQARAMAQNGGIGLAQHIFKSLKGGME
jgi:Rod binding domain-containing protein